MELLKIAGLLLFFCVFVGVFIGALRRPRAEVEALSKMALDERDLASGSES